VADVALVCGAGGALGSALVAAFRDRGDGVVAVDRHPQELSGVRSEAADLTDANAVEALWERLDEKPRWVVNAVGAFRPASLADTEPDDFRFLLDVNLGTVFWSCRAAARRLESGGAIVNVAARSALTGGTGSAAYSVTKAAVLRLTQVLADELKERNVRANVLLPALIGGDGVPAEEIAAVALFLCSDAAAAISGAAVPVYGSA
jgi:NAD(P)-dependent dehydrogenase (short-subunit alcohol dehydrogenase family)